MESKYETNMSSMLGNVLGPVSESGGGGSVGGGAGSKPTVWTPDAPIPQPNYTDSSSRLKYSQRFVKKYGNLLEGRGDDFLNVNETPRGGRSSAKEISTQAAKKYGIDPSLLYSSAMEEGMSGLFKSKATGLDTHNRKPSDFGYQDFYGDKEYPINGGQSFGFQTFAERFPELVKGGYLPKEFYSQFRGGKAASSEDAQYASPNNFKSVEASMTAKAAMIKFHMDHVDKFAKDNDIKLSDRAKEFFSLVGYNGGEGTAHAMMKDYNKNGYLKNDKFLTARPTSGEGLKQDSYKKVYENIARRFKIRDALLNEGLFKKQSNADTDNQ